MGDVWRAQRPQNWLVSLVTPPEGGVTDALLQLLDRQTKLNFA